MVSNNLKQGAVVWLVQRNGPTQYLFEQSAINGVPDQPGVFAIFAANKEHLETHLANANLRGAVRREAAKHPEALEEKWFFVYKTELDAERRATLLGEWESSPESILVW